MGRVGVLAVLLLLTSPYFILFSTSKSLAWPDTDELIWALKNSFLQSILSSLGVTLIGIPCGFALASQFLPKLQLPKPLLLFLLLWPSLLPTLFLLTSLFSLFPNYPLGLWGIVIAHILTGVGVFAYFWQQQVLSKTKIFESAYLLGAAPLRAGWELIRASYINILNLGFLFFCSAFVSFSIPLALGGGKSSNIEILIFEQLRTDFRSGKALSLCVIQTIFLAVFALLLNRVFRTDDKKSPELSLNVRQPWIFYLLLLSYLGFCLACATQGIWQGMNHIPWSPEVQELSFHTLAFAFGIAGLSFFLLLLLAWVWNPFLDSFLFSVTAPSTALLGASLVLLSLDSDLSLSLAYIFIFSLFLIPSLYRMQWSTSLRELIAQKEVAWQMGTTPFQYFQWILWPQISRVALTLAGLAGLWAAGDFALIKMTFTQDVTLSQLVQSQMSSYQFQAASGTMLLTLFCGLLVFGFFRGLSYVGRSKFK